MTDPVAEAAAQIAAQAEPTGLVSELAAGLHKLEETVEHFIHPEATHDAAGATPMAAGSTDAPVAHVLVTEGAAPSSTEPLPNMAVDGAAASSGSAATAPAVSETGGEAPQAGEPLTGSTGTSNQLEATNAQPTTGGATPADGEAGNAAASPAAEPSASATASSAPPASPASVMQAASDSGVLERAHLAISRIRSHLWTFDTSAVQHLHNELDFLEGLFK
jgi:hypothetical protein